MTAHPTVPIETAKRVLGVTFDDGFMGYIAFGCHYLHEYIGTVPTVGFSLTFSSLFAPFAPLYDDPEVKSEESRKCMQ